MISINDLRLLSCFNINEYENDSTKIKIVQFKKDDDLNDCLLFPCHYWTSSEEIAKTIKNTPPIEIYLNIPFPPFETETFQILDDNFPNSIIQRTFFYGKEWRRCYFSLYGGVWGKWVNIDNIIDRILNNEDVQKNITKSWERYTIIDKNNCKKRTWTNNMTKIDEIIKQIKMGTAKIYRNKLV